MHNLFKASAPRQSDVEQILPDIKKLFGAHHVPQKDIEPLMSGEKKSYKEDDIFKRRKFHKLIDMFEKNAGDKPLFPHKMAEKMYKSSKASNKTTAQDIQKESEKLKDKTKIKVETKDDINKQKIALLQEENKLLI